MGQLISKLSGSQSANRARAEVNVNKSLPSNGRPADEGSGDGKAGKPVVPPGGPGGGGGAAASRSGGKRKRKDSAAAAATTGSHSDGSGVFEAMDTSGDSAAAASNTSGASAPKRMRRTPKAIGSVNELKAGFGNFKAKPMNNNDGQESVIATLRVGDDVFTGKTGDLAGHAEMDSLHVYIKAKWAEHQKEEGVNMKGKDEFIRDLAEEFKRAKKEISCPKKSCCCRCASVMGLLEVQPGTDTFKSEKTAGSGPWGASQDVKKFISAVAGKDFIEALNYIGARPNWNPTV